MNAPAAPLISLRRVPVRVTWVTGRVTRRVTRRVTPRVALGEQIMSAAHPSLDISSSHLTTTDYQWPSHRPVRPVAGQATAPHGTLSSYRDGPLGEADLTPGAKTDRDAVTFWGATDQVQDSRAVLSRDQATGRT